MKPKESHAPPTPAVLWLLVALGLVLRLIVAHVWIGSTDVKRWLFFRD